MKKLIFLIALIITTLALSPLGSQAGASASNIISSETGTILQLPNDYYLLLVTPNNSAGTDDSLQLDPRRGITVIEHFLVPEKVDLRTHVFKNRSELETYLLTQYVSSVAPPSEIPDPEYDPCPTSLVADPQTSVARGGCGTQFSGPPRIFILLPTSGPAFMPIAIGGTNFDLGAKPFFSTATGSATPSISLFNWSTQNLPLIGSISVGFTIVPPAAPAGPGDVVVEYLGQRSNPFPFTVQ